MKTSASCVRSGKCLLLLALMGSVTWGYINSGFAMEPPERPPVRASACLISDSDVHSIRVELARTPAQKQFGLMERTDLPEDAGMLFLYQEPRPPSHSFWMYNTLIPLDIAFISAEGEIRAIQSMAPCPASGTGCPSYPAGVSFTQALEMNLGYFERKGIAVGDRFALASSSECH